MQSFLFHLGSIYDAEKAQNLLTLDRNSPRCESTNQFQDMW